MFRISAFSLFCTFFILLLSGCSKEKEDHKISLKLQKREFQFKIPVRGEIYSSEEKNLTGPDGVRGAIDWILESGTPVDPTSVVIRIKSKNLDQQTKNGERRIQYARRRLTREKRRVEKEKLALDLKVLEKEYELATKSLELEFEFGEKDPRVLKGLDLKIQLLEEKIQVQKRKLDSYMVLAKSNSISRDQLEKLKKNLASLQIDSKLEKLEKKTKKEGATGLQKEKLLLEKTRIEKELHSVQQEREDKKKTFPLRIQKLELEISKREKDLQRANERLERSIIKAQSTGVFQRVKHRWQGTMIAEGTDVWRGMSIGKIVNFEVLTAKVRVPEKYVDYVHEGMRVKFQSLRLTQVFFEGKVSKVENMASTFNPSNPKSSKFHWVHVDFDRGEHRLVPGETIEGELFLHDFKDVFLIPKEVVSKENPLNIPLSSGPMKIETYFDHEDYFIVSQSQINRGEIELEHAF